MLQNGQVVRGNSTNRGASSPGHSGEIKLAVQLGRSGEYAHRGRGTAIVNQLGFLSVLQENGGFLGGYLVTNYWGRPVEFRLSTAVQPNRVQQILYGPTL